jgi:small neutral amino acid transporter SnatA (MarC family)
MSSHALVVAAMLVAAVNAPRRRRALSISERPMAERRLIAAIGAGLLAAAVVAVALLADPLLDALDISAPNARIAAGLVVAAGGLGELVTPRPRAGAAPRGWTAAVAPVWFPVLFRPEVGLAALSLGEDHGVAVALAAALVAGASVIAVAGRVGGPATGRAEDADRAEGSGRTEGADRAEDALGRLCSAAQVSAAVAVLLWGVFAV